MDKGAMAARARAAKRAGGGRRVYKPRKLEEARRSQVSMQNLTKSGDCGFWRFKRPMRLWYNSRRIQVFIALIIFANFLANCIKYSYPDDESFKVPFYWIEVIFAIVFLIELLINMYSHWFRRFAADKWNWFDFLIVAISIIAIAIPDLPGVTALRLVRAFRVFKLFRSIKSMRKIIKALEDGLGGVVNAFIILVLVISLYAILGVEFFRHMGHEEYASKDNYLRDSYNTAYFGNFWEALYTLFQVMLGDSWNEAIGRKITKNYPFGGPLFFTTYILIATIMLLNVAVAVLLEKLFEASQEMEEEEEMPYSLQIRINSATDLPKMDLISEGDPYVKITAILYEEPGKKPEQEPGAPPVVNEQVCISRVCKNTRNPIWKQVFTVGGKEFVESVRFELYDWENWFKVNICRDTHDFIGAAEISLSDKHFRDSMKNLGQEGPLELRLEDPDQSGQYRGTLSIDLLPHTDAGKEDEGSGAQILEYLKAMDERLQHIEQQLGDRGGGGTTKGGKGSIWNRPSKRQSAVASKGRPQAREFRRATSDATSDARREGVQRAKSSPKGESGGGKE